MMLKQNNFNIDLMLFTIDAAAAHATDDDYKPTSPFYIDKALAQGLHRYHWKLALLREEGEVPGVAS